MASNLVGEALGLIWAARRGLSETELRRLLAPADLPELPLATWAPLRAAVQEGLVDRGGILNFAHDSIRAAVEAAFAPDEDGRDELRLRLADDFERQPISSRSCDELPWLLLQTESYQRLRACLLNIDRFLQIHKNDEQELRRYWVALGKEKSMGKLYLASFEQWSRLAHRDDSRILYAADDLCQFFNRSGLLAEAEPLMRSALEIETKKRGSNHEFVATRLSNLARLLEGMDRLDEVEGLYRRALAIREEGLGPAHAKVAISLSNLAEFLLRTNRLDEAENLARRALAIDEECFGHDHPNVAIRLNLLARLFQRTDRPAESESSIRRSLAILEKNFGPDHPKVAASLSNLVVVLHQTDRLAEAEPLLRRVLAIDEKNYGLEHIAVARDLNNLAGLLEHSDQPVVAEPLYRRAQIIFEKNLGADHPDVGSSLNNLAQALKKMNRLTEAEPILLRAVQIFLKFTRATRQLDPRLQLAVNNYGRLLEALGRSRAQIYAAVREIEPEYSTR